MLRALVQSLRPHQWTKNLVVFAALGLSKHLFEAEPLLRSLFAFAVFCGLSGTVYLVNDIADVERDRLHPRKRLRPIASGALALPTARLFAVLLGVAALLGAARLSPAFLGCAAFYLVLNLLYSFRLKDVVIVDVLAVSLGFVLRAVAGAAAIPVQISDWLLICTILLALFLTLCKRRHELVSLSEGAAQHRRILAEYSPYLLDQMIAVVTASCVTAYAFYTTAPETREKFQTDRLTWTIPIVLYGIFRYLYLVHQKEQGGSPTDVLLTDRPLLLAVALWALAIVAIVYTAQGVPAPLGAGGPSARALAYTSPVRPGIP
jgi:4-hydroxybenzoate polyprenyltransferase